MPVAHTIRCWLWRTNGVLAVAVIAVWAIALHDDADLHRAFELPARKAGPVPEPLGPDVTFAEMVALVRPFHGWGPRAETRRPAAVEPTDGRLPLRALEVALWLHDPTGPDLILLNSKDPAQSEAYLPLEGQPDGEVAIERIERCGRRALVTITRGEERCTFPVLDPRIPTPATERIVRITPHGQGASSERVASVFEEPRRVDVKVLPFFGPDGLVQGARVTGVRPGSDLARAGLRAGDVIVGIDDETASNTARCRHLLGGDPGGRTLVVRRGDEENVRRLDVGS